MPSRAAAAVAKCKKTLSDSEVLAYSKNRFVEHNLRKKVQQLSDQEQVCHDRHQLEITRWRNFIRQSTRTTGVWSTELNDDSQQWPDMEDDAEAAFAEQDEDPFNSAQIGSPRANPSTELARSLTFQSEALSQLQKPWAYTYTETSHNTLYKDALEVARVKEQRLLFRRVASATGIPSLMDPHSGKPPSQAPSSRAPGRQQVGKRGTRPLTGRSTPGVTRHSPSDSRRRLSASASVHKIRPKTSADVLCVYHRQQKAAWVGKEDTTVNDFESNPVKNIAKCGKADLGSSVTVPVGDSCDGEDSVMTTMLELVSGEAVDIWSTRKISEEKLPALTTSKHVTVTIISDSDLPQSASTSADSFPKISEGDGDTVDSHSNQQVNELTNQQVNLQVNQQANQETNGQVNHQVNLQENEQVSDVQGDDGAQVDTMAMFQTAAESRARRQRRVSADTLQLRLAVWKQATDHTSDATSKATGQSLTTLPEDESQAPADQENQVNQSVNALPLKATEVSSQAALSQSEDPFESKDKSHKAVAYSTTNGRTSDFRSRTLASGQRVNGNSDHVSGINSVPAKHSAIKRRDSFMKIADQLEALRTGNRRRSFRGDDVTHIQSDDKEESNKPEQEATTNDKLTANDKVTADAKDDEAVAKNLPGSKPDNKPTLESKPENRPISRQLDKSEEGPRANRPVSNSPDSHPVKVQNRDLKIGTDKAVAESYSRNSPHHDRLHDGVDFYPSDVRSLAESDSTTFKGYKIRNYIRPQLRHRVEPARSSRRDKSMIRLTIEYPVFLNGNRGDFKSPTFFPKTCRQKVLQELVQRNHQPVPMQDSGVVPPELKAKIAQFLKTIEPYCPKSEIIFDQ